ncbi:hypothetical protein [Daejeonella sp.]|uniref:hypothetical protein n=1 Tax=Daejeonella sp. TaxID=2805397 RepID=UPI003982E5CD
MKLSKGKNIKSAKFGNHIKVMMYKSHQLLELPTGLFKYILCMKMKPKFFSGNEKQNHQPGVENKMTPKPEFLHANLKAAS